MRGSERRITPQGRRAQDRRKGPPAWVRIAILAVTLAVAAYVLLFAREMARPGQEADALRMAAVDREARLLALEMETRIAPVEAAVRAAVSGARSPAETIRQARAAARACRMVSAGLRAPLTAARTAASTGAMRVSISSASSRASRSTAAMRRASASCPGRAISRANRST